MGLETLLSVFPWAARATQQESTRALDKLLIPIKGTVGLLYVLQGGGNPD